MDHAFSHSQINLFTEHVIDCRNPNYFDKPQKLETYKGTGDPDEHGDHVDTVLYYHQAKSVVKCKTFVLNLKSVVMTWLKAFEDNSINSLMKLLLVEYGVNYL